MRHEHGTLLYREKTVTCNHSSYKETCKFNNISLYKCMRCRLVFTNKKLLTSEAKELYEDYYKNETAARFNFGLEIIIRLFRFFRAFKIFTIYPQAKRILDIGSGRGFMLYYLKKYYRYQRTAGTQISKNALIFSRNSLGLEIYDRDLLELSIEDSSFDIITIWHVLEHIAASEKYIEKTSKLLKPNGKLVIEVPNFNSWTRSLTNQYWLGLDLDYHINFFTPKTLSSLLKKYNFNIKTIHTFSLEYSTFISTQSFVSLFTRTPHILFNYLQKPTGKKWPFLHILLFIPLSIICFFINVMLFFSKKGEVLLIVAEKKDEK